MEEKDAGAMNSRLPHFVMLAMTGIAAFALGAWLAERRAFSPQPAMAPPPLTAAAREDSPRAHPESVEEIFGTIVSQASEPDGLLRLRRLREALDRVPASEVRPLLERIDGLPARERRELLEPVFARLCTLHPELASDWARGLPKRSSGRLMDTGNEYLGVFKIWQRQLPEAALGEAQKWPEQFGQIYASRMLEALLGSEGNALQRQLAPLAGIPPGRLREKAVMSYLWHLGWDATRGAKIAEAELSPDARREAFFAAFVRDPDRFKGTDEQLAILKTIVADKTGAWGAQRLNMLVAHAADRGGGPQRVAEWTLGLPEGVRVPAAVEAVTEWAKRGDIKALDWARKNGIPVDIHQPDSSWRQPAVKEAPLIRVARKQPEQVAAWLNALPPGPERERLITYALHNPAEEFHATLRAALGR